MRAGFVIVAAFAAGCSTTPAAVSPKPRGLPALPGPGRARGAVALAENRRCEGCHAEVAREWRGSGHQLADLDPAYQRALAIEPLAFCRSCHAPEADPARDAPPELAGLGVGCVTCHGSLDAVLAAPRAGADDRRPPHAIVRDARFASQRACANCHEFEFPDAALRGARELMQSTLSEHARSGSRATACSGCHMPSTRGAGRHHGFGLPRDEAALRDALDVRATRIGAGKLRLELRARGVGHAFPTGDLFRRLAVSVQARGDEYSIVRSDVRYLARHFRPVTSLGAPQRVLSDDRLGADGSNRERVELDLGPDVGAYPLAWQVRYERVEHPIEVDSERALVESEVVLAEGSVPAERFNLETGEVVK